MVNTNKLKGKLVEHEMTQQDLADLLGMDRSTFYRKMKEGGRFSIQEVNQIVEIIPLTKDEALDIFFAKPVA